MSADTHVTGSRFTRRIMTALGAVALTGAWITTVGQAPEHPSEHPTKASEKAGAKPNVSLEDVAAYTERYVKDNSSNGVFSITDDATKKKLSLTLDKVHRERLSQVGPDMYFVCADFKTTDGRKIYDLDLFVQGTSKDTLRVVPGKTSIHKEDGKERYTWALNEKSGTWEQKPVGAASTKPAGKKAEHPERPKQP